MKTTYIWIIPEYECLSINTVIVKNTNCLYVVGFGSFASILMDDILKFDIY